MRAFLLIAAAVLAFAATMTFETTDANAVVCARGVVRAGCAGYRGAVVVRRTPVVAACRRVLINGCVGAALHITQARFRNISCEACLAQLSIASRVSARSHNMTACR